MCFFFFLTVVCLVLCFFFSLEDFVHWISHLLYKWATLFHLCYKIGFHVGSWHIGVPYCRCHPIETVLLPQFFTSFSSFVFVILSQIIYIHFQCFILSVLFLEVCSLLCVKYSPDGRLLHIVICLVFCKTIINLLKKKMLQLALANRSVVIDIFKLTFSIMEI